MEQDAQRQTGDGAKFSGSSIVLANPASAGLQGEQWQINQGSGIRSTDGDKEISNATSLGLSGQGKHEQSSNSAKGREREAVELVYGRSPDFWAIEPNVGGKTNGLA
jgi:hypothetical protein